MLPAHVTRNPFVVPLPVTLNPSNQETEGGRTLGGPASEQQSAGNKRRGKAEEEATLLLSELCEMYAQTQCIKVDHIMHAAIG